MSFSIIGTGSAYPEKIVTNDDLSKFLDTSDDWITTRTGIKERRIQTTESISDYSYAAAVNALENANVSADQLDLIICATVCGDYHTPSLACVIAKMLKVKCPAFDINAACSGFLYALDAAQGYFACKKVKKVLIVCAENMSRLIDWSDRSSCVLFGDGAGAAVLGEGDDLLSIKITADGNTDILNIPVFEGNSPFNSKEPVKPYLNINGQEVYKFAVSRSPADIKEAVSKAGLKESDVSYVLLHQANLRIISAVKDKTEIPKEKFLTNISKYGNTSGASIPILLDEENRKGTFKKGDYLVFSSFGGGLTTGACVIKW